MRLPPAIVPILKEALASPLVPKGTPLEVWKATDHRAWIPAFTELSRLLLHSDLAEDALPAGYVQVAYLFDWETQCQFDGWHAFDNREDSLDRILECFRQVGLADEAEALRLAFAAWVHSGGEVSAASNAYEERRHAYSVDLDRLEYLACHFVDNADALFYLAGET